MKHRILKTLAAFLLPTLLLSGCLQGGETMPPEASQLIESEEAVQSTGARPILPELFSLPYAPDLTLDPVTCVDGMQQVVASLLCEGLFRLGPDLEPIPCLCSGYTYDPDTYTYHLQLRERVTFSNGSPLTAEDVKATLQRARSSERYGSRLAQVSSISVTESGDLAITLTGPNSGFPALLDIPIVKAGTETAPIGTGPYLFSAEQSGAYLIANQTWWRGSNQPTDRIALIEASDQETMLYRFTSHDVQLITTDLIGTNPISATGSIAYQDANTTVLQYIGINVTQEPLNHAAFRQALNLGIPRDNLVSALLSGHGQPASLPVSPVSPLYPEGHEVHYSVSDFAAALADCGYTADRTLTLLVNQENSFKVSVANEIAAGFSDAGVPVSVRTLPWDAYMAALTAGEFDLYYGEVKLTADWNLTPLLGTGGALNYGGWTDPLTDQLLANFSAADDRATAMTRLCDRFQTQAPILPICFKSSSVLMQSDVLEGLTPTMAEPFYNLTDCAIHLRGA